MSRLVARLPVSLLSALLVAALLLIPCGGFVLASPGSLPPEAETPVLDHAGHGLCLAVRSDFQVPWTSLLRLGATLPLPAIFHGLGSFAATAGPDPADSAVRTSLSLIGQHTRLQI